MPYPGWWGMGAADLSPENVDDGGGGPIHPVYGTGNNSQLSGSVYNQHYDIGTQEPNAQRPFDQEEYARQQAHAKFISELVHYMMVKMEPTDRCLRPPGDIYYPPDWKYAREIDGKWVLPDGE